MNLRPHQETSRNFLANRTRAYLGDEPRVGKTPAAIMAARDVGAEVVTVVCPAVVVGNWRHEWERWWPGFSGSLEVVSYDRLIRMSAVARMGADLVILDEAHYCKNTAAKRTRASIALGRNAERTWLLSGTPMPNHPGELYAPLAGFWPEMLRALGVRNYTDWLNLTCHWKNIQVSPRTWVPKVFSVKSPQLVQRLLDGIMLRRSFKQVSGKEPIWWGEHLLDASRSDINFINGEFPVGSVLNQDDPNLAAVRHEIGRIKAPLAAAVLREELREDPSRKIIVVAYHLAVLQTLAEELAEFEPQVIDGSTSGPARDVRVKQFQTTEHRYRVLIGQHKAIREGITVDRADEVNMVEMVWTPGDNEQVANRASSTEKPTVPVRVFSLADTVDEAVNAVLLRKERMQNAVGL